MVKDAGGSRTHLNCFAGSRRAVWLQRRIKSPAAAASDSIHSSLKVVVAIDAIKSGPTSGSTLERLPLPHGQRSLRPSFSSSSLSPWTMRTPRLTLVSEGKPFAVCSSARKKIVRQSRGCSWDTSFAINQRNHSKCPRQESNLVLDLRRVACESGTLRGRYLQVSRSMDSNQWPAASEGPDAIRYTIGTMSTSAGVEPREAVLEAACSPRSTLV